MYLLNSVACFWFLFLKEHVWFKYRVYKLFSVSPHTFVFHLCRLTWLLLGKLCPSPEAWQFPSNGLLLVSVGCEMLLRMCLLWAEMMLFLLGMQL